jgi:hypothetical protein
MEVMGVPVFSNQYLAIGVVYHETGVRENNPASRNLKLEFHSKMILIDSLKLPVESDARLHE